MAEPDNMILVLLREMRAEMNARFEEVREEFSRVESRFDRLEKRLENIRQAAFGESVLGRYAAAEVEERLERIEKRPEALEGHN
jgi:chaperonin cofactor prefoldin